MTAAHHHPATFRPAAMLILRRASWPCAVTTMTSAVNAPLDTVSHANRRYRKQTTTCPSVNPSIKLFPSAMRHRRGRVMTNTVL